MILHTKSQEDLKNILDELRAKGADNCTEEEFKVAAFFAAAMDEDAVEKAGTAPLEPVLKVIQESVTACKEQNKSVLAKLLGTMALEYGIGLFMGIGVSPDNSNTDHSIVQVSQGGLGLPDRDYYFDAEKESQREAYRKTVALMLTLLQDPTATEPTADMTTAAVKVYELEKSLAEAHMTKTENRDPHATYNKMSIADFVKSSGDGSFDFASYLEAATTKSAPDLGDINIRNVEALKKVAHVISTVEPQTLEYYMKWHTVRSCASYMSKAFVDASFDFYEKTLEGTQEIKPRWKRAMTFTENALGEALGKLYCAKYFDESAKERALGVVEQVRIALEARLKEVEWMTADATREEALKKMNKFGVKIGYPDKWLDYTTLKVDSNMSFLEMVFGARKFDSLQDVKEMNAPTDRLKWVRFCRCMIFVIFDYFSSIPHVSIVYLFLTSS